MKKINLDLMKSTDTKLLAHKINKILKWINKQDKQDKVKDQLIKLGLID